MALWRAGERNEARRWYDQAVAPANKPYMRCIEFCLLRAEVEGVMGITPAPK